MSGMCELLPRDILHSVYGEWLGWKDLSRLDLACVEKTIREVWLTSLTDLRKLNVFHSSSDGQLRLFYKWLGSHRVYCVKEFPVSLNVLEAFTRELDIESYCPVLRSIFIERWKGIESNLDIGQVKSNLSDFLSHCHSLQGVTIRMNHDDSSCCIVLEVLVEKLRENSLITISLLELSQRHCNQVMLPTLLAKHASSLQHLKVSINDEKIMSWFVSILIENQIHLRVLNVDIVNDLSQVIASLISYVSSAGDLLENLEVEWWGYPGHVDVLMVSVAASCPKLTHLALSRHIRCSMENLRILYEQCPHLQYVYVCGAIYTNNDSRVVSVWVNDNNDDWVVCLSHALRRRQYKEVTLILREEAYYHPVDNLKSILDPYEIHLETNASEASLISLLQDLPHLNSLHLVKSCFGKQYTDAILTMITKHARSLRVLKVEFGNMLMKEFRRFDRFLSELIKSCQLLEKLKMSCYGLESVMTVSKHSSLRLVELCMYQSEEMLDGLLDEKVTWPSTLEAAVATYKNFAYKFNEKSRHWVKQNWNEYRPLI